jgi:hypothetical protein
MMSEDDVAFFIRHARSQRAAHIAFSERTYIGITGEDQRLEHVKCVARWDRLIANLEAQSTTRAR